MKSIYERIKNNIRPILQLLLLVGVFFAPRIFKITELIKTPPKLEASQKICDYIFYFAWKGGDWAIGVFFLIVVLFIIRKWNKTYMFNRGNYYKQYRYGWYRICSKILGYSECNLIQVPIYMQFKLVLNDTFDKYNCGEFDKKENDTISVSKSNFSHETDEVNVMISDTYPLSLSQLPEIKKNIPTLLISRNNTNDVMTIGLCGDLKFGRTVHSLIHALVRYPGIRFVLISPEELKLPSYIKNDVLDRQNIPYEEVVRLEDALPDLDILYMTRVQKERFFNEEDYIRLKDFYILTKEKMELAKDDMIVLHPLPRVNEISVEVDDDPRAAYFTQVQNGVYVRMALILTLLGIEVE